MQIKYRVQSALAKFGVSALRSSGFYDGYFNGWRGRIFDYAESAGIHILPVHYYSPIPDKKNLVRRKNRLSGVNIDIPAGTARAQSLLQKYAAQITDFLADRSNGYDPSNSGFHPLDAAVLYAKVRDTRPKQIIEIGSGMSTFVIAAALKDEGLSETTFTCIEPFLPKYLRPKPVYVSEIVEAPLQSVSIDRFEDLQAGDILFIDSTHVVSFGSDVVYEILEILPILKPGVIVHVHDIFLPDDYPDRWVKEYRFFWNEQYMLQAFLSMNPNYKIEIPVHAVKAMLNTDWDFASSVPPASLWMARA